MKTQFVSDTLGLAAQRKVSLAGWIANRRRMGKVIFLEICDSTGSIQAVFDKKESGHEQFELAKRIPPESAVEISGDLVERHDGSKEILAKNIKIVGLADLQISPRPRSDFDVFNEKIANQLLSYRHLYLRNKKIMAILRFRSLVMGIVREWFAANKFLEFDAPILTPTPLYDGSTAIPVEVHGDSVYLTQCAGFYLEAAVHAFERIYNMGPSFRGEESRSKRHLMEYWHIKAELAWGDREDIIKLVEDIIIYTTDECQKRGKDILSTINTELCTDGLKVPYPRITYEDAIRHLSKNGFSDAQFGQSLSSAEEEKLSKMFDSPFWIVGIPRSVEPFPYSIDPSDQRITMVADLIASNGYGELLGVAEKIFDPDMLDERLKEKGKSEESRYQFVKDVHHAGCVPHIAFGMGVERLIRWLLNIPHVRDAIPFPRVVRRRIGP
ncbi:MAG: asparagine--tRNA ligase [Patescibacteria group bacterium]|nr:asparagine--tRNA ligase [Patescibacteria group bacterium]